ncbi:MAG TPA: M20/M25/M40 family metallo-hydrolase [Bryobacteraceae bacterium]|nr:M20/M25/M40 family metallo-hydrolase [Bryobacteraceae bacterium]
MTPRLAYLLVACGLAILPAIAQAPGLADVNTQLRAQETKDSQLMWWLHEVTDVYGPRLTGSPGLRAAQDFAVGQMVRWGFSNVHLEAWDFNHPGWQNWELEANAISPFQQPLNVRAVAWTPGTNGPVQGPVLVVEPPQPPAAAGRGGRGGFGGGGRGPSLTPEQLAAIENPGSAPPPMPKATPIERKPVSQADLDAYLATIKDKVRGAIILYGPHVQVAENFVPAPFRRTEDSWSQPGGRGGRGGPAAAARGGRGGADGAAEGLTAAEITQQVSKFLINNGALAKVTDAGEAYGTIRQQSSAGYNENPNNPNLPSLLMGNEDYGRIYRTTTIDHIPVVLRINIHNEFYPSGRTVYNVVGELPGSDKADEVVMNGGHFDSWNGATGATDNAAGGAVAVEALRLIHVLNLPHRRTIRVALWSGEEEGLYGSIAYVAQHFGSAENPKPEWFKLDAYLNLDSGTSKPRGANVFGPPEAAAMVQNAMDNFKDWGFYHVNPTLGRQTGGTDSTSFNNAGLPGVGYSQDPFDYGTFTHHTSYDTYERIYEPDMREAAVEEALTLYALANADQMVPRCSAATMPPPPPPAAGRGGAGRGGANLPVTPVSEFRLPAGVNAPERPSPCTAAAPVQAAPVSWPTGTTPGQQR